MGRKVEIEGGTVFQICASRYRGNRLVADSMFGTRQLETSTLWIVERDDNDQLSVRNVHNTTDAGSHLLSIDLNPFIKAEVCELRKNFLRISRQR